MAKKTEADTAARDDEARARGWLEEIAAARKRENDYRKEAETIVELYENEKRKTYSYNILYANIDTLSPALYNTTPRPVVKRRFKDDDLVGRLAAQAGQRILQFLMDTGNGDYADFDDLMTTNVLEGLLTSRGVVRFKYMGELEAVPASGEAQGYNRIKSEIVCGEPVSWNRLLYGYAKRWADVPWEAFIHYMDRDELRENFGEKGEQVQLTVSGDVDREGKEGEEPPRDANVDLAPVYEILDKKTEKQIFVSPGAPKLILKENDDPYSIQGFFPNPQPLSFVPKISDTTPIPLYRQYAEQAKELNEISCRINNLVKALKIRGAFDGSIDGLKKILEAGDNELLPIDNMAQLTANARSMEAAIWLFPIDSIIAVIQQLYLARQQCLQVIYELTGVADIMRGSSNASETFGAQELKNQWGTLRLKKSQKRVQRYVRDCLRIMLEMAVAKMQESTIAAMTGMSLPSTEQKEMAKAQLEEFRIRGQQPPPQLQEIAMKPSWGDILATLRDNLQRNFRIDIETNSTVDAEATEDKENIGELLNAISQFLNGVAPLMQQGFMPFDVAKGMLMAVTRRFRLGDEFEEILDKMQQPPPKEDPKVAAEKQRMENEKQMHQMKMQGEQQKTQMSAEELQMKLQAEQQRFALEKDRFALERERMMLEHQIAMKELEARMIAEPVIAQAKASTTTTTTPSQGAS